MVIGGVDLGLGEAEVAQKVEVADIAPSVAKILRLAAPAQSQGQVLPWPMATGK